MNAMNTPEQVARRILNIRLALNLNQANFAKKLNICVKTLQRYERAKRVPDILLWFKIEAMIKGVA